MENCAWFMRLNVKNKEIGIAIDEVPDDNVDFVYLFTRKDGIYDTNNRRVIRYYEGLSEEELEAVICEYVEHNICHAPQQITSSYMKEREVIDPEE